ncbi:hypothetical protein Hanom_Chr13g01198521 [Helianthus anomalus]
MERLSKWSEIIKVRKEEKEQEAKEKKEQKQKEEANSNEEKAKEEISTTDTPTEYKLSSTMILEIISQVEKIEKHIKTDEKNEDENEDVKKEIRLEFREEPELETPVHITVVDKTEKEKDQIPFTQDEKSESEMQPAPLDIVFVEKEIPKCIKPKSTRLTKPSEALRSPYKQRVVKLHEKKHTIEARIADWIFSANGDIWYLFKSLNFYYNKFCYERGTTNLLYYNNVGNHYSKLYLGEQLEE